MSRITWKDQIMIVITPPGRLKAAVFMLYLSIPLVALEVMIVAHASWWHLPLRLMAYWALMFLAFCLLISIWLLAGRKWAFSLLAGMVAIWVVSSGWVAFRNHLPLLGFLSVFLGAGATAYLTWLKKELGRSFFDPKMPWYQHLPRPVPGLKCQVSLSEIRRDLDVSRLDLDGAFVYFPYRDKSDPNFMKHLIQKKKIPLSFSFQDRRVTCHGTPVVTVRAGGGVGFQFRGLSSDTKKEITDFVETLRGEGYLP